jgi:hypothetical protein
MPNSEGHQEFEANPRDGEQKIHLILTISSRESVVENLFIDHKPPARQRSLLATEVIIFSS